MPTHLRLTSMLLALTAGCATYAPFRCPANGGPEWREYVSAHFVLDSDVNAARGAETVAQLENVRAQVLLAMVGEQVDIPGRLRVLAFARPRDFELMAGAKTGIGAYYRLGRFDEPAIVVSLEEEFLPDTLVHELTHYLSRYLFPDQPLWFSEGLAQFMETLALPGGRKYWDGKDRPDHAAGGIPRYVTFMLPNRNSLIRPSKVLFWKQEADPAGAYHASSWLLYHWLWNKRGPQLAEYQRRLSGGEEPRAAWQAVFPEFALDGVGTLDALDDELEAYRIHSSFVSYAVRATGPQEFSATPLPSAELHLTLESLRVWAWTEAAYQKQRRAELDEAVREAPQNAVAQFARASLGGKPGTDSVRAAAEATPDDWRGWALLGSLPDLAPAEAERADRRALELHPDSSFVLNNLAWTLARAGRAKEALPLANRALDLAPWDGHAVDTLAEVAARLGHCAEAEQLETRAANITARSKDAKDGAPKRQSELAATCQAAH